MPDGFCVEHSRITPAPGATFSRNTSRAAMSLRFTEVEILLELLQHHDPDRHPVAGIPGDLPVSLPSGQTLTGISDSRW